MAPVRNPARKSTGNDDTNRVSQPNRVSLPKPRSKQVATAPSPASSRQQSEDLEYGSEQDDGTVMEDIENASEASIGSGDQHVGLASAVSALCSYLQTLGGQLQGFGGQLQEFGGQLQTNNTLQQSLLEEMRLNNQNTRNLEQSTRLNTKTTMM